LRYTEEQNKFFERRSTENLVETYRQELLQIVGGESCLILLPTAVRRQLRQYGILLKMGSKYEVTPKGREMLVVIGDVEG